MADPLQYKFMCVHYEEHSAMEKEFILTYFLNRCGGANELSLFDVRSRRVFLKRGAYDQDGPVRLEDMYVSGTVTICARQFKITAYGNSETAALFERNSSVVLSFVGSSVYGSLGYLLTEAAQSGLGIKRAKTQRHGRGVALEIVGPDASASWAGVVKRCLGPSEASAVSSESVSATTSRHFDGFDTTATHDKCSLCIVRPHAVREGLAGAVLSGLIDAGLEISALQTFSLLRTQAENFYEVYKTVVPSSQYSAMISELASGLCLAIEVRDAAGLAVEKLRELCGPYDVEIARHLRPSTLRARFGRDNVHNVVHCTDLPEDGVLESQYFFSILPSAGAVQPVRSSTPVA